MSDVPVTYVLAMEMHHGDRLVGTPKLTVAPGEPTQVEIGDKTGNRYAVRMIATPQASGTVAIQANIDFVSAGVRQSASPTMVVAFDKPSAIAFGIDGPVQKPFRLDFTISKVADRPS